MARSALTCPTCSSPLVQIDLGAELTLRSCSMCDSRWWSRGEQAADLDLVLETVARSDRGRKAARAR